nr:MAG: hypothetical protein DIU80_14155 [Chloroflexota bacterium]
MAERRAPGGRRAEAGEVDGDAGGDLPVGERRELQRQDLAHRQPVGADPQLALAGHVLVLLGGPELHAGGQLALLAQVLLGLLEHRLGEGRPVDAERVALECQPVARLGAERLDVAGGRQERQEVAAGRERGAEVVDLLPVLPALARKGPLALDLDLDRALLAGDAAAALPEREVQRSLRQVGLAFEPQVVLPALLPDARDGGERRRDLGDVGVKAVGAGFAGSAPGGAGSRLGGGGQRGEGEQRAEEQRADRAEESASAYSVHG